MKKFLTMLMVASIFSLVACGPTEEEKKAAEVEAEAMVEEMFEGLEEEREATEEVAEEVVEEAAAAVEEVATEAGEAVEEVVEEAAH